MPSFRDLAKRFAPTSAVNLVRQMRRSIAGPPIEEVELRDYRLVEDPSPVPRLTMLVPTLSKKAAMGGANTYVEVFLRLAGRLKERGPLDLRIIVTNSNPSEPTDMLGGFQSICDFDVGGIEIHSGARLRTDISARAREQFLAVNWYAALNAHRLIAQQAARYGSSAPLLYMVQDYTPSFFPFSSTNLLNIHAIEHPAPTWRIYNSQQLYDFYLHHHGPASRDFVFSPKLNFRMKAHLPRLGEVAKKRQILVYGRPSQARNCFPILRRALEIWAERHPEQSDWEVRSIGEAHAPIKLADGRMVRSVGKLSLDQYAETLLETAVGISLMASPHPSYPPLEMAHFGVLTLTNRYANKDLAAQAHENITSLPDPQPDAVAEEIAQLCKRFEAAPETGLKGRSKMPDYLSDAPFECLEPLAEAVDGALRTPDRA